MRRSSWGFLSHSDPPPALPTRPYLSAALVHGALAVVILVLGWTTSAHVGRSAPIAFGYFVLATGWTWWRFRIRQQREAEEAEAQ